ncbi:MAG: ECF transporter S component [Clostridiales bacterium]|jgi:ECF transporter S component (folate family)|nr:ECF transporter S component [Clostridiales bacterium]
MDKRTTSLAQQEIAPLSPVDQTIGAEISAEQENTTTATAETPQTQGKLQNTVDSDQDPVKRALATEKAEAAKEKRRSNKILTYTAVLVALSVAMNAISNNTSLSSFSFAYTVDFFAGMILGPIFGFVVGFLGDLIGYFISPTGGSYIPTIGIASGLLGFIPGVIMNLKFADKQAARFKRSETKIGFRTLQILAAMSIVFVVCTLFINSLTIFIIFIPRTKDIGNFLTYLWLTRLPAQLPIFATNVVIIIMAYFSLDKLIRRLKGRLYD